MKIEKQHGFTIQYHNMNIVGHFCFTWFICHDRSGSFGKNLYNIYINCKTYTRAL